MQIESYRNDSSTTCFRRTDNFLQVLQRITALQPSPLTSVQKAQASYMAHVKSTLERSGYDVTVRCKKVAVQIEVGWKGIPLLSAVRSFDSQTVHLRYAAGLELKDIIDKTGTRTTVQTSHKAYNDFVWAELEILSSITSRVESDLKGFGSSEWFRKNLPGADGLRQGHTLVLDFVGARHSTDSELNLTEIFEEAAEKANDWNDVQPNYDETPIALSGGSKFEAAIPREHFWASLKNRDLHGTMIKTDPGWNGLSGSAEARVRLDNVTPYLSNHVAIRLEDSISETEIDDALEGWDDFEFSSPITKSSPRL